MRALLVAIGLVVFSSAWIASAQSVPKDTLRNAVAIVVARGVNETDSSPVESVGTGFFINSMGLLVTSYHLRENLGAAVNPGSVSYEVHFDQFSNAVPAKNVYDSPEADILILYVPVGGRTVNVLRPADPKSAKIELAKTPVYAASFAAGYDFSLTPAFITSWSGPVRPLVPAWTTNVNFAEGQSGSPLVVEDGRVVAIVKGSDLAGASIGIVVPVLFIPTQYWDSQSSAVQAFSNASAALEVARVVVSKTVVASEPRQVVRNVSLTRNVCDPRLRQTIHIPASTGMTIDPNSVSLTTRAFSGKDLRNSRIANVSNDGFDVAAEMIPQGVCVRVFGRSPSGPPARFEGEVRYLERPGSAEPQRVVIADAAAVNGVDVPIGKKIEDLNFTIKTTSGTRTFTPQPSELKTVNGQKVLNISRVLSRIRF